MQERKGREYWLDLIQRHESEKRSVSRVEFCSQHDVNVHTFRGWLYGFRNEGIDLAVRQKIPATFVEVGNAPSVAMTSQQGCLLRFGELEIAFEQLPNTAFLSELVLKIRAS